MTDCIVVPAEDRNEPLLVNEQGQKRLAENLGHFTFQLVRGRCISVEGRKQLWQYGRNSLQAH